MVTVEPVQKAPTLVTLGDMKEDPKLEGMLVRQRGMRLSVQPVTQKHFAYVLGLAGLRQPKG
jgi:predicted RNA-binding protein with PUA-like domain